MIRWLATSWLAWAIALAGCGSRSKPAPPPESAGDLTIKVPADAVIVAEVNGVPIYGDCVATQVEHGKADTTTEALQQCVDFELLAQEAYARGYLRGRELVELRKREATRAFMEAEFASKFSTPADVPETELRRWYERAKPRYVHGEIRKIYFVRARFPPKTPPGSAADWQARSLINEIAYELRGERFFWWRRPRHDLSRNAMVFLTRRAAGERYVEIPGAGHSFARYGPVEIPFRKASFAIERVGQVSPPVRMRDGWAIILLEHIEPPRNTPFEEAKADLSKFLFQSSRGAAFLRWAEQFISIKTINQAIEQQATGTLRQLQAEEDRKNLPALPADPS